nr:hypothetical protein [Tanacetum cinerariifolium]
MLDSKAYKEYYTVASRAEPLKAKTKYKNKADELVTSPKKNLVPATQGIKLKSKAKVTKPDKKKQPTKKTKAKGLAVLSESKVHDEQEQKTSGTDKGTNTIPRVLDVPLYESESDKESWGDSEDEDDIDDDGDNDDDGESDDHDDDSDDKRIQSDSDEIPDLNLTHIDQTEYEEENVDERVSTPSDEEKINDEETTYDEVIKDLYDDVNVNLGNDDTEMNDANQGVDNEIASLMETSAPYDTVIFKITSGFTTTTPPPPPFFNPLLQQQTPTITTPTFTTITSTNLTVTLPKIPNFASVFKFDQRVSALESEISELKQTNQFSEAVSSILGIVDKYLSSKMKEAVNVVVQLQTNKLREEAQEFELKKILIDKMETNKSINRSDTQKNLYNELVESYNSDKDIITLYGDVVLLKIGQDDQDKDEDPSVRSDQRTKRRKSSKDVESSKDLSLSMQRSQVTLLKNQPCKKIKSSSRGTTINNSLTRTLPKLTGLRNLSDLQLLILIGLRDVKLNFDHLRPGSLKLHLLKNLPLHLRSTCKSITELEYHLEECSKAITERLDWHNPKNKPYPFDLRKPPPLIQDRRGRHIIPKDYFINKDVEYLKDGDSRRRYLTYVMTTKAATYELKWIKDLVLELWSPVVVNYDQHAYFGTSHWGPKRQRFYGYASNLTSCKDVYSRRRIIIVTRHTIMKKYDYGHLEEIEVHRDDQQLYTFKEDPHGIIYVDQFKRKRLMRTDELHKFSDRTLNDVRTALYDIAAGIRMYYLPMRKCSNLDKKRARVMVQDIDKQHNQRRLMRNLEKFIGRRPYEEDLWLLERTI